MGDTHFPCTIAGPRLDFLIQMNTLQTPPVLTMGYTVSFEKPGQLCLAFQGRAQSSWWGGGGLGFPFRRLLVSQPRGKTSSDISFKGENKSASL